MKKLLLLTNDHIKFETNSISSDFNDTINIIQAISKNNFLYFFCRKKNESGIFKTSLKKIKLKLLDILSLSLEDKSIFMISITPYNFIIYQFIKLFNKKVSGLFI